MTPQITVQPDESSGAWRLFVFSHGKLERAGPRLFRGGEIPYITFTHEDKARAETDAQALRDYLATLPGTGMTKAQQKRHGQTYP